jgi:hypothetical protein
MKPLRSPCPAGMVRRRALLTTLCGWAAPGRAEMRPPLPSIVRAIRGLSPNQAVQLGNATVVGELNDTARHFGLDRTGPRARDFCRRMAWAPSRGRALFTGANHGSPHRLNDVWEFDLPSLAWVLLYPPDLPRSYGGLGPDASDVVFLDGTLQTKRGGPAVIGHTWSGLTWDPQREQLLFMNTWPIDQDNLVRALGADPTTRDRSPPLWTFDPSTLRWQRLRTPPPWPKAAVGALLEYVPELAGSIWHLNNWQLHATWLLDDESGSWERICDESMQSDFRASAPGRELVGYHDPDRRLVVAQCRHQTFHFDTRRRRWSAMSLPGAPDGHDARGSFVRNPANGAGILIDLSGGVLWSYDPDRTRWRILRAEGPPMPAGSRTLGYADARRGVVVVVDDLGVWAYRPPANP